MSDLYDAIIAGAGPAGGSAAYFLGEAGKRVLVLERERLPRYKTCGGGLSTSFLERQFPFSFEPVLQSRVKALSYAFDGRLVTIPVEPGVVCMVMRDQFDAHLLAHARAEVRQGVAVRNVIETGGHLPKSVQTRIGIKDIDCFSCSRFIEDELIATPVSWMLKSTWQPRRRSSNIYRRKLS